MLQALGHEVRWHLVRELLGSDLKVGELTAAIGQAQNLTSYHLKILRDAGLVRERRGSADGRDVFYSLDRRAVTSGLLSAMAVISPGSQIGTPNAQRESPSGRQSVLFVCTGNSARSQLAEAMMRNLGGRRVRVRSAGTHPAGVHAGVQRVLEGRGIHSAKLRSKSVAEFAEWTFDYVVSLCDIARGEPIEVRGNPTFVHWSIPDPVTATGGQKAVAKAFEMVASEIEVRVGDLYADLTFREPAA